MQHSPVVGTFFPGVLLTANNPLSGKSPVSGSGQGVLFGYGDSVSVYLLQPAQAGIPALSLRTRTLSPFFTSAAMMTGLPDIVTREPLTSTLHRFFSYFGFLLKSGFRFTLKAGRG